MMQITAQYERKFSDGNYGSEGVSLGVTFTRESDTFDPDELLKAASALRGAVLEQLAKSAAHQVAAAAKRERGPAPQPAAPMSDEAYFDAMADASSY